MKRLNGFSRVVLLVVCSALLAFGQSAATKDSNNIVPRLVRFSGALNDTNGKPLTSTTGVTFSLYKDSDGGAPLWVETQNVQPDSKGHYTVLLGSTKSDGVSSDLFASGEARWLGVQPQGKAEQARVLMVSVPYALKAVDAETLGGKPASAFQLALPQALSEAPSTGRDSGTAVNALSGHSNRKDTISPHNPPCAAASNYIPFWNPHPTLCNSEIWQTTVGPDAGYIGVNQTSPSAQLDVQGAINASPIAAQTNSGNYQILEIPVLGIGWPEAKVVPANGNLYVGMSAGGQGTANVTDSGLYNTFVGTRAGVANQSGTSNTFLGYQSGEANTTGNFNAFLGTGSGKANTGGSSNTFLGYRSGLANSNGKDNTFLGFQSGFTNTNGASNTFLGPESGFANTTGAENTFVGLQSGFANTTGVSNAFLGLGSGLANTTGAANTFLGAGACANITTGNGDICIGYGVSAGSSGTSNTILIGTEGVHTAAYVAGIYSEAVGATNSLVCVDNNGKLGTNSCTGAGTGTVTSVGSGLGLTGGPITTSGTLKIDTTIVPLLNTANVFTANQTINGSLSATSSSSDGVLGVSNVDNTGCPSIGCAGVVGVENGSINDTIGVYGYTASSVGAGVYGQNQSPSLVAGIPPDPSAGVWGDSSNQVGVQGTSDNNSAFYGENNTPGNSIATGWFVNDSSTVGDLVVEADGGNGSCLIDVNGDLSCSGALSANNITTGSGGTNTDLAGSCTLTGGTCSQTFSTSYLPAPICVATDTSTVSAVQVSVTSTTLTITGPPGDGANYICIGQEVPPPMKKGHGHRKVHRTPAVRAGSRENK